jgi:glycosyltransferase involved in cell wall biosynthesis
MDNATISSKDWLRKMHNTKRSGGKVSKKQKTLAIIHYSCPPVIGGVEFVIRAHASLFVNAGYRTRIIVGNGKPLPAPIETFIIPELSSTGGPMAGLIKTLGRGKCPPAFKAAVKSVERLLEPALKGVDVCMIHNVMTMHFNLVMTAALANIMRRSRSTRFIGWTHDATFRDPAYSAHHRNSYPWDLMKRKLPGCDYCVISAQRQREIAKSFGIPKANLPVISDGINVPKLLVLTPRITRLFYEEKLHDMDIVALTPTRIVPRKNLEAGMELVAAFKLLGKNVRWLITGAPDPHNANSIVYFKKLLKIRRVLDVENEVIFLSKKFKGHVQNKDLRGLFAVADMMILPSRHEGFGLPALEGGLAGMLMVLSDIPALKEIAGHDAVYMRTHEKPIHIARRAIYAFKASPRLVFRKKMITDYSWHAVFSQKIVPAIEDPASLWPKSNRKHK